MIFDPMFFVFLAPGILLALYASWKTKSTFNKYSRVAFELNTAIRRGCRTD